MPKFDLGFVIRGSSAPEVKQIVEAGSMRQAMLNIVDQYGGDDVVLVTHAHPVQEPDALQPSACGLESPPAAPRAHRKSAECPPMGPRRTLS